MQSHLSESKLETEPSKQLSKTPCVFVGSGECTSPAIFTRDLSLCTVTKKSPLKLSAPRKIMGRDGIKLKQQLKNHTEKHYTHTHTHEPCETFYHYFIYSTPCEIRKIAPF